MKITLRYLVLEAVRAGNTNELVVAHRLRADRERVKAALRKLTTDGFIKRTGRGEYEYAHGTLRPDGRGGNSRCEGQRIEHGKVDLERYEPTALDIAWKGVVKAQQALLNVADG